MVCVDAKTRIISTYSWRILRLRLFSHVYTPEIVQQHRALPCDAQVSTIESVRFSKDSFDAPPMLEDSSPTSGLLHARCGGALQGRGGILQSPTDVILGQCEFFWT